MDYRCKYKRGDRIEITVSFKTFLPSHSYTLRKGTVAIIMDASIDGYIIRSRGLDYKVNARNLDNHSILLESNEKEKRYDWIVEEGLSFGKAMDKLLFEGCKVTRKSWDGYWVKQFVKGLEDTQVKGWNRTFIVAVLKDGGYAIATPYQEDMFANDWMVVE